MQASKFEISQGDPNVQGAHVVDGGINFALYSESHEKAKLHLFNRQTHKPIWEASLPDKIGHTWAIKIEGLKPDQFEYLYTFDDNPEHFAGDPFAEEISDTYKWVNSHRADVPGSNLEGMPRARVPTHRVPLVPSLGPVTSKDIIYEINVKGATKKFEGIPENERGTLKGLAHPLYIAYLKDLGVTAIELLPIAASPRQITDNTPAGIRDFNRYNPLFPCAISPDLLSTGERAEYDEFYNAMQEAGIKIILDTVANHTMETGPLGPSITMRAVDSKTYYNPYDVSGVGEMPNSDHPQTRKLFRQGKKSIPANGYRNDLGPARGQHLVFNEHGGMEVVFDPIHESYTEEDADPELKDATEFEEPWVPGGTESQRYQLGNFASNRLEWSDQVESNIRRFWRGDQGMIGKLGDVLGGSSEQFQHNSERFTRVVNRITSHDGFSLEDLVSFETKQNWRNGENNNDGKNENDSSNWGVHGYTDNPYVNDQRLQVKMGMMATLMMAHGFPLILGGDEIGNRKQGDNNDWNQDNDIGWVDYDRREEPRAKLMHEFTKQAIGLRKFPCFSTLKYLDQPPHDDTSVQPEVRWLQPNGNQMRPDDWNTPHVQSLVVIYDNAALPPEENPDHEERKVMVVFNGSSMHVPCKLVAPDNEGGQWEQLLSTDLKTRENGADHLIHPAGQEFSAPGRSVSVFVQVPRAPVAPAIGG